MSEDEPIIVELWDSEGKQIYKDAKVESLPEVFRSRPKESFTESGFRSAFRTGTNGAVRIVFAQSHPLLQGQRAVQRACAVYLSFILKIKQIRMSERQSFDAVVRRFSHNLGKFQNRFKASFQRLISEKARARPFSEFKEEVQRRIEENTSIAATDVCQMSHRATDLDAQIETLRIISGFADNSGTVLRTKSIRNE